MTDGLTAVDPRRPRAEGGAWLNLGCGTHTAPAPWWNVDVVRDGETQPDEVVPRGTLPYLVDSCARVMLSHLMEHVPWGQPLLDVLTDCRRLLAPGGTLLAIGPDAKRTATLWKQGQLHDELMWSVLEHANGPQDLVGDWPEARHWWNCTEARMVLALETAGFANVAPWSVPEYASVYYGDGWPIVGPAAWQCGAIATAPDA